MAYLALKIPESAIEKIKEIPDLDGLTVKEKHPHISLFYFRKDLTKEEIRFLDLLMKEKLYYFPLYISLNEMSCFSPSTLSDMYYPFKFDITNKQVLSLRRNLESYLAAESFDYSKDFEYHPHLTLGYYDRLIENSKLFQPITFEINEWFIKI